MYQDMMDDQLAVQLSQGRGLGLADMLIRQLSQGAPGADATRRRRCGDRQNHAGAATQVRRRDAAACHGRGARARRRSARHHCAGRARNRLGHCAARRRQRRQPQLLRHQGGRQLARCARRLRSTSEFVAGVERGERAQFRAYGSVAENVADYVRVLREPRYAAALGTGSDVRAFADALQRGGYATDPQYANKLVAVADQSLRPQRLPSCRRCEAVQVGRRRADSGNEDEQWLTCSGQVCPVCVRLQRALDTTAHNIANVSTAGYTRQRVDFATRQPQAYGSNWIGSGVNAVADAARLRPVPLGTGAQFQRHAGAARRLRGAGRAPRQSAR